MLRRVLSEEQLRAIQNALQQAGAILRSELDSGSVATVLGTTRVLKGDFDSECIDHLGWAGLRHADVIAVAEAWEAKHASHGGATGAAESELAESVEPPTPSVSAAELESARSAGLEEEARIRELEASGGDLDAIREHAAREARRERELRAPRIGFRATSSELQTAVTALLSAGGKGSAAPTTRSASAGDSASEIAEQQDAPRSDSGSKADNSTAAKIPFPVEAGEGTLGESCGDGCRCVCESDAVTTNHDLREVEFMHGDPVFQGSASAGQERPAKADGTVGRAFRRLWMVLAGN